MKENNIVECAGFQMYSISASMLFGKSPKIHYFCGSCDSYNETRIPVQAVKLGRPYTTCKCCGTINKIPIQIGNDDYDDFDD